MKTDLVVDFLRKFIETDHLVNIAEHTEHELDLFELIPDVEYYYEVSIIDEEMETTQTVQDLEDLIAEKIS